MTTEEKAHKVDPLKPLGQFTQKDLQVLYDGLKARFTSDNATVGDVMLFKDVCEYLQLLNSAKNGRYPFVTFAVDD